MLALLRNGNITSLLKIDFDVHSIDTYVIVKVAYDE